VSQGGIDRTLCAIRSSIVIVLLGSARLATLDCHEIGQWCLPAQFTLDCYLESSQWNFPAVAVFLPCPPSQLLSVTGLMVCGGSARTLFILGAQGWPSSG